MPNRPPVHRSPGVQTTAERRAAYDAARPSPSRIYNARWWKLRRAYLAAHPLCECGCGYASTVVDHRTPHNGDLGLSGGGGGIDCTTGNANFNGNVWVGGAGLTVQTGTIWVGGSSYFGNNVVANARLQVNSAIDFGPSDRGGYVDCTTGNAQFQGLLNVMGRLTCNDFQSNNNIYAPNGWVQAGTTLQVGSDATIHGNLWVGGTGQINNSRFNVVGGNSPGIGFFNSAGGGPFAIVNSSSALQFGVADATGNLTLAYGYFRQSDGLFHYGYQMDVANYITCHQDVKLHSDVTGYEYWLALYPSNNTFGFWDAIRNVNPFYMDTSGYLYGTFASGSDSRLKQNVQPYARGLAEIAKLEPVTYQYNGNACTDTTMQRFGVVADDVAPFFPEMVGTLDAKLQEDDEETVELRTTILDPLLYALVNAMKELAAKVEALEAR